MPSRPKPPCSRPGCEHSKPCPIHTKQANRQRGSASQRGYGQQHRDRFRRGVLDRDPVCVLCHQAPATVADHHPTSRRDLAARGLDPDDPQHGRGLCASCHGKVTQANPQQRGGWNAE
jgi:5-methylcytosine-specific restriction protein A